MRKENSTNSLNRKQMTTGCPITATVTAIGGRWKIILLWQLREGPKRYGEIKKAVPAISEKMLTQQLKELMESGWVQKKDYQEIPPRTEYRLTKLGASFMPILQNIYQWGTRHKIAAN